MALHNPDQEKHPEASQQAGKTGKKFDDVQYEVIREGARFYERLTLLSGGALVLSVSFLGYLSSRQGTPVEHIQVLYTSWGMLLAALLASIFRNLYHQYYLLHATFAMWARDVETLKEIEVETVRGSKVLIADVNRKPFSADEVEKFAGDLETKRAFWGQAKDKSEKGAESYTRVYKFCEYVSQLGFFFGLLLMVFFAVANTP